MRLDDVPFAAINWDQLPVEDQPGEKGVARSRTFVSKSFRVRMVDYSPGYAADHWCHKGHIVFCVRGRFLSKHRDGSVHEIGQGMSYIVGENDTPHRSSSESGATLFIVD